MVYSQTLYQKEVQIERISISSADSRQMGSLCTLGESVHNQYILEGRIPGCERFGHAWAVPENAIKPKRLTPGVKAKRSSSICNTGENIRK